VDLADASLIVVAEAMHSRKILTIDCHDFATYRIRRGPRYSNVEIVA
jgi:predicted nucleic acid-binding protein